MNNYEYMEKGQGVVDCRGSLVLELLECWESGEGRLGSLEDHEIGECMKGIATTKKGRRV